MDGFGHILPLRHLAFAAGCRLAAVVVANAGSTANVRAFGTLLDVAWRVCPGWTAPLALSLPLLRALPLRILQLAYRRLMDAFLPYLYNAY